MAASHTFVDQLLDVIDKHINSFGGSNEAKLALIVDITAIPASNQSLVITQHRLLMAAKGRWA